FNVGGLPRRDCRVGRRRFDMQAETRGDDLIQLRFFLWDPIAILKFAQRLPELQQPSYRCSRISWMEARNDLTNLCGNRCRIRDTRPVRINAVEKRARHRLAY